MSRKVPFSEMSARRRIISVVLFIVSLGIVVTAEKDLHRRADSEIRGNRLVWRLVSLNALGAIGYLRWGRISP